MKGLLFSLIMVFGALVNAQQSDKKLGKLYADYIEIKDALTTDNSAKASSAAKTFVETLSSIDSKLISAEKSAALKTDASNIQKATDIKKQRDSFFGLSDKMVEIVNNNKIGSSTIFVQYCPMAKGQWLSNKKEIRNPYYGKSMLECGYVTSEIK